MKSLILVCLLCMGFCQSSFIKTRKELSKMENPTQERRQASPHCIGQFEGDMIAYKYLGGTFEGRCSSCVCKSDPGSTTGGSFDCRDTCETNNPMPPLPGQPYCDKIYRNKQYVRRVGDTIKLNNCWYCTCNQDASIETGGNYDCFLICYGQFPFPA